MDQHPHTVRPAAPGTRRRRGRRIGVLGGICGLATVLLAACGGGTSGSSGSSGSSSSGGTDTITVGVGSSTVSYAAFWVAQENNLFAKNGINVKVVSYNTSGETSNLLASGQIQLAIFGANAIFQLNPQGKQAEMVDELSAFNTGTVAVVGAQGVTSADQLRSKSGCRIATTDVGTVPYAYAALYQKAENLGNCKLILEAGTAPLIAAVSSGSAQAGIVTYANALPALAAKKATLIVNPLHVDPTLAAKVAPNQYPTFGVIALKSTISAKQADIEKFLTAIRQANTALIKESNSQLGAATAKLTPFSGDQPSQLAKAWQAIRTGIPTGSNAGFIPASAWAKTLQGFVTWSIPGYSPTNSAISYGNAVNMSLLQKVG
jgi:ABC-type nitrate/sulfonate/bicarbonate transport system substrate-binding protein